MEGIYTMEIAPDVIGWVGLNSANMGPGFYEFNPVIGVRHQALERLLAQINGDKFHSYIPPSISTPIGYIMPESTFKVWHFHAEHDNAQAIGSMLGAIDTHARAFQMAHVTLSALLETLQEMKYGWSSNGVYRIPAAWYLLGDTARCLESLDEMEQIAGKWVPLDYYCAFTARFRKYIELFPASQISLRSGDSP